MSGRALPASAWVEFATLWQASSCVRVVAEALGICCDAARSRARTLRKLGVELKHMPCHQQAKTPAERAATRRAWNHKRREQGLCIGCPRPTMGTLRCEACLPVKARAEPGFDRRAYWRDWYRQRREDGRCIQCGVASATVRCRACAPVTRSRGEPREPPCRCGRGLCAEERDACVACLLDRPMDWRTS